MDTTTTTTQVSDSVEVTGSMGVAAQTATFMDSTVIDITSAAGPVVSATSSEFNDDNISGFFRRPLLINTYTWPSSVAQGVQIQNMDPWYLYLNNPIVVRKTSNYYKISGEMVLDVVLQAAPTNYGHAIVQLIPQGVEIYVPPYTVDGNVDSLDVLPTIWQSTQDIYGDLVPATSETLEFRLPWISTQDSLDLASITNTGPLGGGPQTQWRFLTHCIAPLGNATNAASVGDVTIRVYARIENVKLSVPITLQTGEKKKKQGKIGQIAGTVNTVAKALIGVPIVGEIAAGVEVVSSAIGAIADWFGFTRTTLTAAPMRVRQEMFPGLANADGEDTSCPLSMLAGNKVSIDPTLFGSGGKVDIESFDDLFRRKTLVKTITWATSQAAGTVLVTIPVTPTYCHADHPTGHYICYPSPAGFIATQFCNWRGPMYYEIQVRCSSLHRGMLQVVYHPSDSHDSSDPTNTSYNKTFEVEADGVHTFRVGWAQMCLWRKVQRSFGVFNSDTGIDFYNGYLDLRIFTKLTAPDPAASVQIEIYTFTDGNMTYMGPTVPDIGLSLQASEMSSAMMTELSNLVGNQGEDAADITLIGGGERIQSVRTLLQRPFPTELFTNANGIAGTTPSFFYWQYPIEFPWTVGTNSSHFNNIAATNWSPLTWIPQMFVGWRGSVRYKYVNVAANDPFNGVTHSMACNVMNATAFSTSNDFNLDTFTELPYSGGVGFSETNIPTTAALEIVVPYYEPFRYMISRIASQDTNVKMQQVGVLVGVTPTTNIAADRPQIIRYKSAGPDFSLGRFRFVPRVFVVDS